MFSKTCEYAIRAAIFIAQHTKNGGRVGIKDIAKGIDSPEHFIAKILQELSRQKIIQSAKGPNGGFFLDQTGTAPSLVDIVTAIDGDSLFTGCALGLKQCSATRPCPIHHEFKKIRTEIQNVLQQAKLDALTDELEKSLTFLRR